jgi:hypothetical protein
MAERYSSVIMSVENQTRLNIPPPRPAYDWVLDELSERERLFLENALLLYLGWL